jgi:iron-sulfur cluster repair protein YtfE (RIC family)
MLTNELVNYDQDLALWVEQTVILLKAKDYAAVDWGNLIEELEGLTRSDKRELENRLVTLFEHALKRRYVPLPDCYRGWDATLSRTQKQILRVLRDSPSLNNYVLDILEECYQDSLKNMRKEYDAVFPDSFPFNRKIDELLSQEFWQ